MTDENREEPRAEPREPRQQLVESVVQDLPRARLVEQRLRDAVWQMGTSDDLGRVLVPLKEGLRELGIEFQDCGVNLLDASAREQAVSLNSLGRDGQWRQSKEFMAADLVRQFWATGAPVYRRDLEAEDLYGERHTYLVYEGRSVRSVVDVPFAYGTLAVNSSAPDAFGPRELAGIEGLATVLEEGLNRREDLRRLEQRQRDLEAEVADRTLAEAQLLQVETALRLALDRERVMGQIRDRMHRLGDLRSITTALEGQWVEDLRSLGIPVYRMSLQTPPSGTGQYGIYWALQRGKEAPGDTDEQVQWHSWVREAWETGRPVVVDRQRLERSGLWDAAVQEIVEVPLPGGGSLGVSSRYEGAFDETAVSALQTFAGMLAAALERLCHLEALQESAERYRNLLDRLPIGIFYTTSTGSVVYMNPHLQAMLGYDGQEIGRVSPETLYVDPEDRAELLRRLRDQGEHAFEHRMRRRTGEVIWVKGMTRAVQDRHGEVVFQGFVEDITESRRSRGD
ncbi:MAG: PAS domain S-box protein [Candidatus Latescibacterota bacterium]